MLRARKAPRAKRLPGIGPPDFSLYTARDEAKNRGNGAIIGQPAEKHATDENNSRQDHLRRVLIFSEG